jgi:hypothetical protein
LKKMVHERTPVTRSSVTCRSQSRAGRNQKRSTAELSKISPPWECCHPFRRVPKHSSVRPRVNSLHCCRENFGEQPLSACRHRGFSHDDDATREVCGPQERSESGYFSASKTTVTSSWCPSRCTLIST